MEPVFEVSSRGTNLQEAFQSGVTQAPQPESDIEVDLQGVDWLQYKGEHSWLAAAAAYATAVNPLCLKKMVQHAGVEKSHPADTPACVACCKQATIL